MNDPKPLGVTTPVVGGAFAGNLDVQQHFEDGGRAPVAQSPTEAPPPAAESEMTLREYADLHGLDRRRVRALIHRLGWSLTTTKPIAEIEAGLLKAKTERV